MGQNTYPNFQVVMRLENVMSVKILENSNACHKYIIRFLSLLSLLNNFLISGFI